MLAIDLRQLCDQAGVALVEAEITGLTLRTSACCCATDLNSTLIGSAWMSVRNQPLRAPPEFRSSPWKPRSLFSERRPRRIPSHCG